ncbi:MAG: type II toxin-antitoxin system RelE/ParE family toxin [Chloroflexi bacterium]|nr:type II toxin-antitoxin system RelE/ParE family toxin [Chloroflexota bacterium]
MIWRLTWSIRARKDQTRLDEETHQRVLRALERFCEIGYGDVKLLHGRERISRLRVGDWRVFFVLDSQSETLTVLRVLHRREAYR